MCCIRLLLAQLCTRLRVGHAVASLVHPPARLPALHSYRNLAKINERFERAYVLQAIEEADWQRRHKAMVDQERSWMRNRPDWVVNKSHYFTLRPDRANNDPVDTRTMTNLNPM